MCFPYLGLLASSSLSRRVTDSGLRSTETTKASRKDLVQRVNDLVESEGRFYLPLDEEEYPDPNQSPDYVDADLFSSLDTSGLYIPYLDFIISPDGSMSILDKSPRPISIYVLRWNSIFDRDALKFRLSDLGFLCAISLPAMERGYTSNTEKHYFRETSTRLINGIATTGRLNSI